MKTNETTAAAAPAPAQFPWRKIVALLGGQGVSLCGDYALLVSMIWTAVQLGGPAAVTTLMLAATIPRTLMLVFGGTVADRLGPRFVLLRTTSGRILLLAAGSALVFSVHALWTLLIIAVVEGVLLGLGSPSYGTIMPQLIDDERLDRANSLYATVLRLAPIIGTPFGAWLIAFGKLWPCLALVALTCAANTVGLLYATKGMPKPVLATPAESVPATASAEPKKRDSLLRGSGDGLRILASNARLRWLFISAFCLDLAFGWPLEVALPLLVKKQNWGVEAVGEVIAVFSAGALVAGAVGAILAHRISLQVRLVVTGVGIAAGIMAMAAAPSVLTLAATGFAVGLMCGLNGPAIVTTYQQAAQAASREKLGASMSMLSLAGIGAAPVSVALFGALTLALGLQTTWLLCGLVALIGPVAAALALRHPAETAIKSEPLIEDTVTVPDEFELSAELIEQIQQIPVEV